MKLHPINDARVSPRLFCVKHRKGKGTSFMDEAAAIRRYGKDWRLKASVLGLPMHGDFSVDSFVTS